MTENQTNRRGSTNVPEGAPLSDREVRDNYRYWRHEMRHRHPWHWHAFFIGPLMILLGLVFLAGVIYHIDFGQWWPLVLIAVGLAFLIRGLIFRSHDSADR